MIHLVAGQNFAWSEPRVTAYLDHPEARVCALLLGSDFRVRDGADLVDRQRPSRSGVDWLAGPPEGVTVDLTRVDPTVEHILCVTSAAPGAPVLSSTVRLVTASGAVVAEFTPEVGPESAVVLVEIYRRGEGWKVRAVGQGYAGGLAQACTAHGLQASDFVRPAPGRRTVVRGPAAADPDDPRRRLPDHRLAPVDPGVRTAALGDRARGGGGRPGPAVGGARRRGPAGRPGASRCDGGRGRSAPSSRPRPAHRRDRRSGNRAARPAGPMGVGGLDSLAAASRAPAGRSARRARAARGTSLRHAVPDPVAAFASAVGRDRRPG